MCDGDKFLRELKARQVKPKILKCTVSNECWCMRVQTRFTHNTGNCMGPKEMLEQTSAMLSEKDRVYLTGLLGRKFVLSG